MTKEKFGVWVDGAKWDLHPISWHRQNHMRYLKEVEDKYGRRETNKYTKWVYRIFLGLEWGTIKGRIGDINRANPEAAGWIGMCSELACMVRWEVAMEAIIEERWKVGARWETVVPPERKKRQKFGVTIGGVRVDLKPLGWCRQNAGGTTYRAFKAGLSKEYWRSIYLAFTGKSVGELRREMLPKYGSTFPLWRYLEACYNDDMAWISMTHQLAIMEGIDPMEAIEVIVGVREERKEEENGNDDGRG